MCPSMSHSDPGPIHPTDNVHCFGHCWAKHGNKSVSSITAPQLKLQILETLIDLKIMASQEKKQVNLGAEYFAWKKVFEREKRFFYIRSNFVPNLKAECLAGKFYSKQDVVQREAADQNFVDMIERESAKGPKDRSEHPATENQCYGWYPELLPLQKQDSRLYRAHQKSHITWLAEQILLGTRDMPKSPPFTGIPFKT